MTEVINKITTHADDAVDRMLYQYRDAQKFSALIRSLAGKYQDVEEAVYGLVYGRAISNAVGVQLDKIGTIVDLARETGLSDERYRVLLYVKIGQNTSQGAPEKLITILKLLSECDKVFYQNLTHASLLLACDVDLNPDNDPTDVIFLYENLQKVAAGGVRIDYLISYVSGDAFAFAGDNPNAPAKGFSSVADTAAGGQLAYIHRNLIPFAFDGQAVDRLGFGTIKDPLVGGTFVST